MRLWSVQLAAMLLLLAQTLFGPVGGKVLCIQLEHCADHSCADHRADLRESAEVPSERNIGTCLRGGHHCGATCLPSDPSGTSDCDCHLHVLIPSDEHVASRNSVGPKFAAIPTSEAPSIQVARPAMAPAPRFLHQPPPSCWATTALRSTRLVV